MRQCLMPVSYTHLFSYLKCPDCGKEIKLFGESHIDEIAKELSVPVLGKLPLDTSYAAVSYTHLDVYKRQGIWNIKLMEIY